MINKIVVVINIVAGEDLKGNANFTFPKDTDSINVGDMNNARIVLENVIKSIIKDIDTKNKVKTEMPKMPNLPFKKDGGSSTANCESGL